MRCAFTVAGPAGSRDVIVSAPPGTCWGDVEAKVRALTGIGVRAGLWIQDRELGAGDRIGGAVLRSGTTLRTHSSPPAPADVALHRLDVVGGTAAGTSFALAGRPATIGRDPRCDIVLADPSVSRIHARVLLDGARVHIEDLGAVNGVIAHGQPLGGGAVDLAPGDAMQLGTTVVAVSDRQEIAHPGDGTAVVAFATRRDRNTARRAAVYLVPALIGVAIAVRTHQVLFAVLMLTGPLAGLLGARSDAPRTSPVAGSPVARWRATARVEQRRATAEVCRLRCDEARLRRAADPDPAALHDRIRAGKAPFDAPRSGRTAVRIGLATQRSRVELRRDGESLTDSVALVPAIVDVDDVVAMVIGHLEAPGLVRWIASQLAAQACAGGPRVVVVTAPEQAQDWAWTRWLPGIVRVVTEPAALPSAIDALAVATRSDGTQVAVVVADIGAGTDIGAVADAVDQARRLRRLLVAAVTTDVRRLPAGWTAAVRADRQRPGHARWQRATPDTDIDVLLDGVDARWVDSMARALAPRAPTGAGDEPRSLLDLLALGIDGGEQVAQRWQRAGGGLVADLGWTGTKSFMVDLVEDGPHALIAGTTGSGKSELLQAWVLALAANYSPGHVQFVLIDFKGGATFGPLASLPHVAGTVTDLDGATALRVLRSLAAELRQRELIFAQRKISDIDDSHDDATGGLARLVVIVDEFAALAEQLPDQLRELVGLAQRGRSLGIHLILATQRPSGVVSAEIIANTGLRIALRMCEPTDSIDVIATDAAARISAESPGDAVARTSAGLVAFHTAAVSTTPACSTPISVAVLDDQTCADAEARMTATVLTVIRDAIVGAAAALRIAPTKPLWLPDLPPTVEWSALDTAVPGRIAVGLIDDIDGRHQPPITVELQTGESIAMQGAPQSGRSGALRSIAVAAADHIPPGELQIYVADCGGGSLADLGELPHCTTLISDDDPELLASLFSRLEAEITRRRRRLAGGQQSAPGPQVLCLVDGWAGLVQATEDWDAAATAETVLRLLRLCPGTGVTVALASDDTATATRVSSAAQEQYLLGHRERAPLHGIRTGGAVSIRCPGRGVRASDGLPFQFAHCTPESLRTVADRWRDDKDASGAPGALRLRPLPEQLRLATLIDTGGSRGPGGIAFATAAPDGRMIELPGHGHVLIVCGPPGSGCTTTLATLRAATRHPRRVGHETPRPSLATTEADPLTDLTEAAELDRVMGEHNSTVVVRAPPHRLPTAAAWAMTTRRPVSYLLLGRPSEIAASIGVRLPRRRGTGPPGRGVLLPDAAWGLATATDPVTVQVAVG
jgi:S-DNA-T family DNA segregation ATPase FtsK/SpoIIIE